MSDSRLPTRGGHDSRASRPLFVGLLLTVAVLAGIAGSLAPSARAAGTVSLTTLGSAYTQDFNTLATTGIANTTLPTGWDLNESGTSSRNNAAYAASTGSDNAGDVYSFGAAASVERAYGMLRSGTLVPIVGASFTNNTGSTVGSIDVAFAGEQWRAGVASRGAADRLDFQLSTDATSLTSGTWVDHDGLDFASPNTNAAVGALDGNASGNRASVSSSITGLSIPDGATFWIRWTDFDIASSDDGLAIDDFSLTPGRAGDVAPAVSSTVPTNGATDVPVAAGLTITFSEAVNVTGTWFDLTCSSSGVHSATVSGGPTSFTLDPDADFASAESCTIMVVATQVTDQDGDDPPDNMVASFAASFTTSLPVTPIREIQGAAHLSPKTGMTVKAQGVVTASRSNGYFLQDPSPDADDSTSEAIFVFTGSAPTVAVGDAVQVVANVTEFRPGGSSSTNLTTTELTSPTTSLLSTGSPLPAAIVVGTGGREPPSQVIEDDASGSVETSGQFDPASDGIDFYESLEAMRVQVNNAVAVAARNDFGEIAVVGDHGAKASVRTPRGGIVVRDGDFNPERIFLDDVIAPTPSAETGDTFSAPIVGVLDYSFGNFKLLVTTSPTAVSGGLTRETAAEPGVGELSIATFNVENLDPTDPPSKFADLADLIVDNLAAPDLLSLEEVQDNNGATNDSVVDASATFNQLIAAIQATGGPTYEFRQINPLDDQDGGEPGGNIRVGFLFRTDRGLSFVDRPGGDATTATTVVDSGGTPELSISPGRVDPGNTAWSSPEPVRKPLVGEFVYDARPLFVITNHWKSKGGDDPLFGRFQPPSLVTEAQRVAEAQVVNDFVVEILAVDPNAAVVVLGDLNDFDFSLPLSTVEGGVLTNLVETLPEAERYSFVFDGNAQTLDHILVSDGLSADVSLFDVVHVNAEFATQASDHDPLVARICADAAAPSLSVSLSPNMLFPPNHKYVRVTASLDASDSVDPGPSVTLVSVTSNEPDNVPGSADGDTVNDIRIDGQTSFRLRAERSETGTGRVYTATYRARDACGNTTVATGTVTVPVRS